MERNKRGNNAVLKVVGNGMDKGSGEEPIKCGEEEPIKGSGEEQAQPIIYNPQSSQQSTTIRNNRNNNCE